jgi:hypothetical protein
MAVSDSSQGYNGRFSPAAQSKQHPQPPPTRGFDRFIFPFTDPPQESVSPVIIPPEAEGLRDEETKGLNSELLFVSLVFLTVTVAPDMSSVTTESGRKRMALLTGLVVAVVVEEELVMVMVVAEGKEVSAGAAVATAARR